MRNSARKQTQNKTIKSRLKTLENDADALQARMNVESSRGNYAAAQQWAQKLADQGKQNAELLNSIAWFVKSSEI